MRLALCKIAHFMLPEIFSEWQPIDSTRQDAFLQAVGIAESKQGDSLTTQWVMKWLPKPSSLPRSLSLFLLVCSSLTCSLLNTPLKLKASLVLGIDERMQVERHFFFLHLTEKMSPLLALVATRILQLSSIESRYSMWVPVLNISILPDIKMPPYILFSLAAPPKTVAYPDRLLLPKKKQKKKEEK